MTSREAWRPRRSRGLLALFAAVLSWTYLLLHSRPASALLPGGAASTNAAAFRLPRRPRTRVTRRSSGDWEQGAFGRDFLPTSKRIDDSMDPTSRAALVDYDDDVEAVLALVVEAIQGSGRLGGNVVVEELVSSSACPGPG